MLLTGDNENAAVEAASIVWINDAHAVCLPEDKLDVMDSYQKKNMPVCMIGGGINDVQVLKKAMVTMQFDIFYGVP